MTDLVVAVFLSPVDVLLIATGARKLRATRKPACGALSFRREGQRVVTATGVYMAGSVFYDVLALLLVGLSRAASA